MGDMVSMIGALAKGTASTQQLGSAANTFHGFSAGFGATNAAIAAGNARSAYQYQAQVASDNATMSEWAAKDALYRGDLAAQSARRKTGQLAGAQRARMAASGVDLQEGSPLAILADTELFGGMDQATIRENAAREAWSIRRQGQQFSEDAAMLNWRAGQSSPGIAAAGSLLTSAGSVADRWYRRAYPGGRG